MTIYIDTLHWWGITPALILLPIWTLLPNLTVYLIARGFHRTFAMGAACQQRTLTPSDTWCSPTLGLSSVLMLRPISPELVLFPDFWVSNIPRYFCFCLLVYFIDFLSKLHVSRQSVRKIIFIDLRCITVNMYDNSVSVLSCLCHSESEKFCVSHFVTKCIAIGWLTSQFAFSYRVFPDDMWLCNSWTVSVHQLYCVLVLAFISRASKHAKLASPEYPVSFVHECHTCYPAVSATVTVTVKVNQFYCMTMIHPSAHFRSKF